MIFVIIYVDDILIFSQSQDDITRVKRELSKHFDMKELGPVKHCLGMEFTRGKDKVTLRQRYIADILKRFGMIDLNPVSTPMDVHQKLPATEKCEDKELEKLPYRELLGALTYLSTTTRPDISFAVSYLGQFNERFDRSHWNAAKRVLRYLKGTKDYGITYSKESTPLKGYVDADWGNSIIDRKSFTGYAFILSGGPITWNSKKQRTVALSSTEAEYMALNEAVKESIHLKRLLIEINCQELAETTIFCDNHGALKLAENPVFHKRSKHIDIRYHFVREVLKAGELKLNHVPTENMLADLMTKALPRPKHLTCVNGLKLV